MKREEKNVLSRQRILDAARVEFSHKGYDAASMNAICAENDISKGIIYHYYKDKDELYLLCVKQCFDALTAYLQESATALQGSAEQKMNAYFDARLHFFAQNQSYLGIFADAVFTPPESLREQIAKHRAQFDKFNKSVLTELLKSEVLREGLSACLLISLCNLKLSTACIILTKSAIYFTLFRCKCPIKCNSISDGKSGCFVVSSCTLFSPKNRRPAL